MAKKVQIKLDGDFKDVILSALRYAIPRHTYILDTTCSWIEANPHLLDSRMVGIMKQDVKKQLKHYQHVGVDSIMEVDYNRLKAFYMWLEDIFNE